MIIDFRVRPPAGGFEKMLVLGEKKGFQFYPFDYESTESIPSALEHSMPLFMEEMRGAGISKAVILPRSDSGLWGGVSNDEVKAAADEYPDSLLYFGSVNLDNGIRAAVLEVERAVTTLGCRGIVVEPGLCVPALMSDANRLYPVYDRCAELGVPVVLSLSTLLGPDASYASPVAVQRAAKDFPEVKFLIVHGSYPHIYEAIAVAAATENIYLIPDIYMNIPQVPGCDEYAKAVHFMQGRRILFASAYPIRGLGQSVEEVKRFNLPKKYYDMLMYENAAELLGL